ncbi:MAG TPA: hypothetical protein VNQ99_17535 [Xanthobacteraceae bacterium]|nr:hypothetical protein [Xanthobacteraceae bacterium]
MQPSDVAGLSAAQQWIVNIALFFGVVGATFFNFFRKAKAPTGTTDMIVDSLTVADMQPARNLVVEVKRLTEATVRVAEAQERGAEALAEVAELMRRNAEGETDRRLARLEAQQR